jgi:phosphoglycerate dehydrogenase-like enzyme
VDDPVNGPREIHKNHPRIICTNHNAGISVESTMRLDAKGIEQVTDAIQGRRPEHILNPEVLDHPRVREWLKQ